MNTEITEYNIGWVFYDGDCVLCRGWVERTRGLLLRRRIHFVPLQSRWACERLGLQPGEPLREMKFLAADGSIFGGADALVELATFVWWAWPLWVLAQLPGIKGVLGRCYQSLAANRHCVDGWCKLSKQPAKHSRKITSAFYELP